MLLALDKLGLPINFADEFNICHYTHENYNWCRRGDYVGKPIFGFKKILVVSLPFLTETSYTFRSPIRIQTPQFCDFVEEFCRKMKAMSGQDYSEWGLFFDSATYHKSGITQQKLRQLKG